MTDSGTLIAGAVSGGIWKSTDSGQTWTIRSDQTQHLRVTSLAQDTRSGQTNTWYYVSGEYVGNSTTGTGASYFGSGMYKSIDNGDTWFRIQDAGDITAFDSAFDFASRVIVHPVTGTVYVAVNGDGILRSTDGGSSFSVILGAVNAHQWSDIAVASNGTLLATLSATSLGGTPDDGPGVYVSTDDGLNWVDVTDASFPTEHLRSVVAFAPSNSDVAYILTFTGNGSGSTEDSRFHKLTISTQLSEDRSANLPPPTGQTGHLDTQGSYNMLLGVKPDDENFVIIGGTNLYRSFDGFATPATDPPRHWIGGYDALNSDSFGDYPNHAPDQHSFAFDPTNPNVLWTGNDGGLTRLDDVTLITASNQPWVDMNRGYNVTQFYHIALSADASRNITGGGAQDNGSPFFEFDGGDAGLAQDVTGGDGAYSYLGVNNLFVSSQGGNLIRYFIDSEGQLTEENASVVTPADAQNQRFINPFAVDPSDEGYLFYPGGDELFRNDAMDVIGDVEPNWLKLDPFGVLGYEITALSVSTASPTHRLYVGLSTFGGTPKVMRMDNSNSATGGYVELTLPGVPESAFINHIAINPENGDEILVVLSNFGIMGIYHSVDAGVTWTGVEGDLEGDDNNPGPSVRSATILPFDGITTYIVGTSTGLYQTETLSGGSTAWSPEGASTLGNAVVVHVLSRTSDGSVAAGTHGRGIFIGQPSGATDIEDEVALLPTDFRLEQNYPNPFNPSTTITYSLPTTSSVSISVFDMTGRLVRNVIEQQSRSAGTHEVTFNAQGLASGVYLYRLHAVSEVNSGGDYMTTKRFTLLR